MEPNKDNQPADEPKMPQENVEPLVDGPNPADDPVTPPSRKTQLIWTVIAVVAFLALAGVTAFYMAHDKSPTKGTVNDALSKAAVKNAVSLSSYNSVSFTTPTAISSTLSQRQAIDGVTTYVNKDGTCEIDYGTVAAASLPGNTPEEIIDNAVKVMQQNGATVDTPQAAEALVLKDANADKAYSLPTMTFRLTQGAKRLHSYYSSDILKSGNRVYVTRVCTAENQDVSDQVLQQYLDLVSKVTVTVK